MISRRGRDFYGESTANGGGGRGVFNVISTPVTVIVVVLAVVAIFVSMEVCVRCSVKVIA